MKRRPLCLWGAATALGLPTGVPAQGKKEAQICVMSNMSRRDAPMQSMFSRLSDLGWSAGWFGSGNLKIEYTEVEPGTIDVAPLVDAALRSPCDLVATTTTPLALAVKSAAPATPLVFLVGGDPAKLGLVASVAKPGGNATGRTIASGESGIRMLALLRELAPQTRRYAVVYAPSNASSQQAYAALAATAEAAHVTLKAFPVRGKQDIHALDPVLTREPVEGLIVQFDTVTASHISDIVQLAALHRLPAVYGVRYFVDAGGLLSYGANWVDEVKLTANFIARILDGEKPADVAVETAQSFELVVNLRTARSLSINVPQSVLARAIEVIQ